MSRLFRSVTCRQVVWIPLVWIPLVWIPLVWIPLVWIPLVWIIVALFTATSGLFAEEQPAAPLHQRIDQLVQQSYTAAQAPLASDEEFLRRIYLDLTGQLPSPESARAFLKDAAGDKRTQLIDRLLASPEFTRHFAGALDVMFMERRAAKHIKQEEWQKYLHDSVSANKPFHQLASEILGADGVDEKLRPAANFYLAREVEANLLTRDVGRVFFGRDMQCAQCHDHPLIDSYYQSDYHGLLAFLTRSYVFTSKEKDKKVTVAEKAEGEAPFQSVFDETAKGVALPHLPGGPDTTEPTFAKGEEYVVKPEKNKRPQPKYSRRAELAKQVAKGDSAVFNVNISNRLWAFLMGQGLVHPLDLHHDDNLSVHPILSDLLAREFAGLDFDMRAFLRELALSQVYQRGLETADLVKTAPSPELIGQWGAEHKKAAAVVVAQKADVTAKSGVLAEARAKLPPLETAVTAAEKGRAAALKTRDERRQQHVAAAALVKTSTETLAVLDTASAKAAAAAKQLPEEKDVAAAAQLFTARAATWKEKVAAATTDAAAKQKAEQTAEAALQQTEQALKASTAARQTQLDAIVPLAAAHGSAAGNLSKSLQTEAAAVRRVGEATRHVETAKYVAQAEAASAADAAAQNELQTSQQRLAKLNGGLPGQQEAMKKTTAGLATVKTAFAEKTALATKAGESFRLVSELSAAAEAARQKVSDDAEVVASADRLKQRRAELEKQHVAMQGEAKTLQTQMASLTKIFATQQATLQAAQAEQKSLTDGMAARVVKTEQTRTAAVAARQALAPALDELQQGWSRRFYVTGPRPLSPEQLAWSTMGALGVARAQKAAAETEADKTIPLDDATRKDPAKLQERQRKIEQFVYDKLKGNVTTFVALFGGAAGQPQDDFFATVDQALFFANGGPVQGWLNPAGDNLTARLMKLTDAKQLTDELYMSVLTRQPSAEESADVAAHLSAEGADRPTAIKELAWALVTSAEFRFNH